jgi:hypothetical protein
MNSPVPIGLPRFLIFFISYAKVASGASAVEGGTESAVADFAGSEIREGAVVRRGGFLALRVDCAYARGPGKGT